MVTDWKKRHTFIVIAVIGVLVLLGVGLGPGPGIIRSQVVKNPKAKSAGKWMLRAASLYKITLRKEQYWLTLKQYKEMFNPDEKEEKGHYYDEDEYIWVLFWEVQAWEHREVRQNRFIYKAHYQEAMENAEDLNPNHPAIEEFRRKILVWSR